MNIEVLRWNLQYRSNVSSHSQLDARENGVSRIETPFTQNSTQSSRDSPNRNIFVIHTSTQFKFRVNRSTVFVEEGRQAAINFLYGTVDATFCSRSKSRRLAH